MKNIQFLYKYKKSGSKKLLPPCRIAQMRLFLFRLLFFMRSAGRTASAGTAARTAAAALPLDPAHDLPNDYPGDERRGSRNQYDFIPLHLLFLLNVRRFFGRVFFVPQRNSRDRRGKRRRKNKRRPPPRSHEINRRRNNI